MSQISSVEWWRPSPVVLAGPADETSLERTQGRFAFRALLAFTIVLVLSPQTAFPALAPFRLALVAATAALTAHLFDRWQHPAAWTTPPEFKVAGCLLVWTVMTLPLSMWPGGSAAVLTDLYLKALVVFWLLGRVVDTVDRLYRLTWTLSLMSMPLAMEGLLNFRAGAFLENGDGRIMGYGAGLAGNPNDLALTLDLILPLSLALAFGAKTVWGRLLAVVSVMLSVACVVVTFSRGGFVALAVIAVLTLLWVVRRRVAWVIPVMVVGLLVVPPLLPSGYVERLETLADIDSDPTHSAQDRMRDTITAVQLIGEHPIIGAGLGNDILALNQARGATWRSVHDVYLQYGVDLGLVGMGLFVVLLVSSIRSARTSERAARRRHMDDRLVAIAGGVRISLLAFAVGAFFYPVAYYFYFYYFAGLAAALRAITGSRES